MKLKEIPRTATFAWSPAAGVPLLATGTAAGAIDPDFSSATSLDLWRLDLADRSADGFVAETPVASLETDARFHDLAFSSDGAHVAGALESGAVELWSVKADASKASLTPALTGKAHSGPVKAVAFSPLVAGRLASGGANGQVFVWDIADFDKPQAPGSQSARHDEIEAVAWNHRVAHILATGGNTGFTSIWDLKKKREVLHLHYSTPGGTRVPTAAVSWHPTNSTKLATASLDDNEPVVLVWDLRNANSPERVLRGHQRGVLSVDWCAHDADLLLSSGRDNRTLLWNPTAGELLGEYPVSVEWTFKTNFHPRMPDVFASASFDGKVVVQTLQDTAGGDGKAATPAAASGKAGAGDDFWESASVADSVHPQFTLRQAPAWLRRPASASFGFGGKIAVVSTVDGKSSVYIQQVKDKEFPEDTAKFSAALKAGNIEEIAAAHDADDHDWKVLRSLAKKEDLLKDVPGYEAKGGAKAAEKNGSSDALGDDDVFDSLGDEDSPDVPEYAPVGDFKLLDGKNDAVTKLVLAGKLPQAVDTLIKDGAVEDALLLASYGDAALVARAQNAFLTSRAGAKPFLRAAWAVAGGHLADISGRTDIAAWPQALGAIVGAADAGTHTAALGKRLEASGRRDDALRVYLAGANVGRAAALWLAELPTLEKQLALKGKVTPYVAHVKALQQTIEKITVATKSVSAAAAENDDDNEALYDAYRDYANLVASQGDLELARLFLDLLPAKYSQEKERVAAATTPAAKSRAAGKTTRGSAAAGRYAAPAASAPGPSAPAAPAAGVAAPGAPGAYGSGAPSAPGTFTPGAPSPGGASGAGAPGAAPSRYGAPSPYAAASNPYAAGNTNPYAPNGGASAPGAQVGGPGAPGAPGPQSFGSVPLVPGPPGPPGPPRAAASPAPGGAASTRTKEGWNDLPELGAAARRTPVAPQIIAPAYAAAAVSPPPGPPKAGASKLAPPPPKASATPSSRPTAPSVAAAASGAPPATTPAHASPYAPPPGSVPSAAPGFYTAQEPQGPPRGAPKPAPANPYAPKQNAGGAAGKPNPYAPPGGATPPPTGAGRPSPLSRAGPPPAGPAPATGGTAAAPPPPRAGPPPAGAAVPPRSKPATPSPASPAPPAAAAAKYPPGDRSHISAAAKPIVDLLSAEVARIQPTIEKQYPKQFRDTQRRLELLYDHLNNGNLLDAAGTALLVKLSQLIADARWDEAAAAHREFVTAHSEQGGQWLVGVKRLIDMGRAVSE